MVSNVPFRTFMLYKTINSVKRWLNLKELTYECTPQFSEAKLVGTFDMYAGTAISL